MQESFSRMLDAVHLNICKCEREIDELGTDAERERELESRSGRDRNTNVIARDWKNELSAEALFCYNLYCGYFELFSLTAAKVD